MPRWGLTGNISCVVCLAAYLGQPLIIRGHHQDLREGIEMLDHLADMINSLGAVRWSTLADLSRMNYSSRMNGDQFRVRPFGLELEIELPASARSVVIEATSGLGSGSWQVAKMGEGAGIGLSVGIPLSTNTLGPIMRMTAIEDLAGTPRTMGRGFNGYAMLRRFYTEGRDRLMAHLRP